MENMYPWMGEMPADPKKYYTLIEGPTKLDSSGNLKKKQFCFQFKTSELEELCSCKRSSTLSAVLKHAVEEIVAQLPKGEPNFSLHGWEGESDCLF